MAFVIDDLGPAAATFLGLFVIYNVLSNYILWHNHKLFSVYTLLWFYGILRIGGQISGLGFAIQGYEHYQWLIAYIVLTVEGYFMLVFNSFHMLIREQKHQFGYSPLAIPFGSDPKSKPKTKGFGAITPKDAFHYLLIAANALLVAGSAMLSGMTAEELDLEANKVTTSKGLRATGQIIFLVLTIGVAGLTYYNYYYKKLHTRAMGCLIASFPFLLIRGIYGVLSIFIDDMNYLVITNYFSGAAHRKLTIYEYVLSTTMEFVAALILLNTYWIRSPSRSDTKPSDTSLQDSERPLNSETKSHSHIDLEKASHA